MKKRDLYMEKLIKLIDTPVIKIITGVRRSGKSNILMLLSEELRSRGTDSENIIYINFELIDYDPYRNYNELNEYIKKIIEKTSGRLYILIDEVQNCSGWERAVTSFLVDTNCDIYLTGSNANMLSGDLATHLAGRYVEMEIYPLTFSEYLYFNELHIDKSTDSEEYFYDYIKYGGFPGLHKMPDDDEIKKQYIIGIFNSVVLKDAIQRNQIRDAELLERILLYIMDNVGQIFSAKRITDYLKNLGQKVSIDSVYSYIAALESSMIIHTAKRYDIKGKKLLQRMEKYFICDSGLRYAQIGYKDNDISQMLENIIYMELKTRGYKIYVGKDEEKEIDFIAEKNGGRIYIQVVYLLASKDIIEREYRPLYNTGDNYPKLVLSMDRFPIGEKDGISWHNILDYLLNPPNPLGFHMKSEK